MLYSQEMVTQLQQLRSRILAEFGVRIRLADPDLLDSLAEMGAKSRDNVTRERINHVLNLAGRSVEVASSVRHSTEEMRIDAEDAPSRVTEVIYRGRKVLKEVEPEKDVQDAATAEVVTGSKTTQRIYRGQIVNK